MQPLTSRSRVQHLPMRPSSKQFKAESSDYLSKEVVVDDPYNDFEKLDATYNTKQLNNSNNQ